MNCKKCGNEIISGDKYCNKCGKKIEGKNTKIITVFLVIFILISIIIVLIINTNNRKKTNNVEQKNINADNIEQSKNTSVERIIREALAEFSDEYDTEFNPTEEQMQELIEFYNNDPNNFNQETLAQFLFSGGWLVRGVYNEDTLIEDNYNEATTMPNLVGMEYGDLREFLDTHGLSYITKIKYITDKKITFGTVYPYKVLSTIPAEGEQLDPNTDNIITVYTNEISGVEKVKIIYKNEKEWHTKYFGKNIKIQVGSDENSIIEGVIEKNFRFEHQSPNNCIEYDMYGSYRGMENAWDLVKKHKIAYFFSNDMQEVYSKERYKTNYVNAKVYIDDNLIKEVKAEYDGIGIIIEI